MLYEFSLTGMTPLLVHADDIEASDRLTEWRKAPENKAISVPGDDRSPAWTWQTYLYTDGQHLSVPYDNLMVSLRQAGCEMILKRSTTFKALTQSGLIPDGEQMSILVAGKPIEAKAVSAIEGTFREQAQAVRQLGFRLFAKRAKIGQSKHIRVRPRFDEWALKGRLDVTSEAITGEVLMQLFAIAGKGKGLCDWRPASPKSPGPFGRFEAEVRLVQST